MLRRILMSALGLLLLPTVATAHGGAWRGPTARTPGDPIPAPGISGPKTWATTWGLNREGILDLRALQAKRMRARTSAGGPRFFGDGDTTDVPDLAGKKAWNALIKALMKAARDDNADVATGAIIALGKSEDRRARALLMELVNDRKAHKTVNESAALALGMIGGAEPEVRKFLEGVMGDDRRQSRTRSFAALGLGFLGDIGAIPALMGQARAKESNRNVPTCAIVGLGLLGDEMIVPNLSRLLIGPPGRREKDDLLRAFHAAALGRIRSRAALPALVRALDDKEVQVRRQAVLSLAPLTRPEDVEIIKKIVRRMQADKDRVVQSFAAIALGEIGWPGVADHLLLAYRKGSPMVVPHAALGLALLVRNSKDAGVREKVVPLLRREFTKSGNLDVRGSLAIALGVVGDRESVKPLIKLLAGKGAADPRAHAAIALGLMGAEEALPVLRRVITERSSPGLQREAAIALGLFGDREAVDILLDLVKNGSSEYVRGSAATALGRLLTPKTAIVLREFLENEKNPDTTRAFVAVALGMVMDRREFPILSRIGDHLNHAMVVDALTEVLTLL